MKFCVLFFGLYVYNLFGPPKMHKHLTQDSLQVVFSNKKVVERNVVIFI